LNVITPSNTALAGPRPIGTAGNVLNSLLVDGRSPFRPRLGNCVRTSLNKRRCTRVEPQLHIDAGPAIHDGRCRGLGDNVAIEQFVRNLVQETRACDLETLIERCVRGGVDIASATCVKLPCGHNAVHKVSVCRSCNTLI
jgi:hypothetical protein